MSYKPRGSSPRDESTNIPGGGTDKRLIARLIVLAIVVVLAVVFIFQNNERVELRFIVVTVTARAWVGLLVALVLGALLGQAIEALLRRRRRGARR